MDRTVDPHVQVWESVDSSLFWGPLLFGLRGFGGQEHVLTCCGPWLESPSVLFSGQRDAGTGQLVRSEANCGRGGGLDEIE